MISQAMVAVAAVVAFFWLPIAFAVGYRMGWLKGWQERSELARRWATPTEKRGMGR